jgi:POT family proton-dependent oligopeptide transporter
MFVFLPFYFICWVQIWNNLISQAGQMALHGTPNDLLQNLDPIALCIFIPILDCGSAHQHTLLSLANSVMVLLVGLYPFLRKFKINFSPVRRIFTGFLLVSSSMVYASVLQHFIYTSPSKSIHVWIQAPAYIFVAISEAFVIVTGLELAFTQAPKK